MLLRVVPGLARERLRKHLKKSGDTARDLKKVKHQQVRNLRENRSRNPTALPVSSERGRNEDHRHHDIRIFHRSLRMLCPRILSDSRCHDIQLRKK
jgi:hypothetical protein